MSCALHPLGAWFVPMYGSDIVGYIYLHFPQLNTEWNYVLRAENVQSDIVDVEICRYELEQLLQAINMNTDYEHDTATKFIKKVRFVSRDLYSTGYLSIGYQNRTDNNTVTMSSQVRIENTVELPGGVHKLYETFADAKSHLNTIAA